MTDSTLLILTGSSRGLGRALAQHYLDRGAQVLGLARGRAAGLEGAARFEQWTADLAEPVPLAERLAGWLAARGTPPARVRLVHNAAVLCTPGDVARGRPAELAHSVRVGLEAPVALTAAFLQASLGWAACDRRVLFVSSGLGRHALAGSAVYCAQKAALDHFARALALEEAARPGGARVASVAPGIIDTDMQVQLRNADPAAFAERARFAQWHASGALSSPADAAARLAELLERDDYGRDPVTDVRT